MYKVFKTCNLNCKPIYKHDLRTMVAEYIKEDIKLGHLTENDVKGSMKDWSKNVS